MTGQPTGRPLVSAMLELSSRGGKLREARLTMDAQAIIGKYPQARSALLPLLHLVQAEDGYLTAAGIGFCADQLGLADAEGLVEVAVAVLPDRHASSHF